MNRVLSGVFSWEGEVGINSISLDKPAFQILAFTRPRTLKKICFWVVGGLVVGWWVVK